MKERNIVLVGRLGSGKSGFANTLTTYWDNPIIEEKSVTREPIVGSDPISIPHEGNLHTLKVIDTWGFTDSFATSTKMIHQWNQIFEQKLNAVHIVEFVIPADRLSKSFFDEVATMVSFLIKCQMKQNRVLIVLNKYYFFKPEI